MGLLSLIILYSCMVLMPVKMSLAILLLSFYTEARASSPHPLIERLLVRASHIDGHPYAISIICDMPVFFSKSSACDSDCQM